jgi:hypothetical protein
LKGRHPLCRGGAPSQSGGGQDLVDAVGHGLQQFVADRDGVCDIGVGDGLRAILGTVADIAELSSVSNDRARGEVGGDGAGCVEGRGVMAFTAWPKSRGED